MSLPNISKCDWICSVQVGWNFTPCPLKQVQFQGAKRLFACSSLKEQVFQHADRIHRLDMCFYRMDQNGTFQKGKWLSFTKSSLECAISHRVYRYSNFSQFLFRGTWWFIIKFVCPAGCDDRCLDRRAMGQLSMGKRVETVSKSRMIEW